VSQVRASPFPPRTRFDRALEYRLEDLLQEGRAIRDHGLELLEKVRDGLAHDTSEDYQEFVSGKSAKAIDDALPRLLSAYHYYASSLEGVSLTLVPSLQSKTTKRQGRQPLQVQSFRMVQLQERQEYQSARYRSARSMPLADRVGADRRLRDHWCDRGIFRTSYGRRRHRPSFHDRKREACVDHSIGLRSPWRRAHGFPYP
jgi:hypothetical protein